MSRHLPQIRFHIDSAQDAPSSDITALFSGTRDYLLGQVIHDPHLISTVRATKPTLEAHAQQLLDRYWTRPIVQGDPNYELDVLIRVVDAGWCADLAEVNGVQGQWNASGVPKILLMCAVPDPERLTARFIHEFGHYLDWTNSPRAPEFHMTSFLRAETIAEQLVVDHVGLHALTHNSVCPPDDRANIRRLLVAEGDLEDVAAQEASFNFFEICGSESGYERRQRVQTAYALVNELVRLKRWTFGELLCMNDRAFRSALLSSPDLWRQEVAEAQA